MTRDVNELISSKKCTWMMYSRGLLKGQVNSRYYIRKMVNVFMLNWWWQIFHMSPGPNLTLFTYYFMFSGMFTYSGLFYCQDWSLYPDIVHYCHQLLTFPKLENYTAAGSVLSLWCSFSPSPSNKPQLSSPPDITDSHINLTNSLNEIPAYYLGSLVARYHSNRAVSRHRAQGG